ncbi:MAG: NUDIX domain-containing protein [Chloroflexota bacterium]|nr:NUDIX domain-containing protein [Chloroflexota bacterium]
MTVVPSTAAGWVVLVLADGRPEVPGGTREPGESIEATLRRELLEEAGALLESFRPFGVWDCLSAAEAPYRPHLPHPRFQRLVGVGRVELVTTPTIGDGEDVVEVLTVSLEEARARFRAAGRGDLADLYGLAAEVADRG